jgi:hypothetical protein
MAPVMRLGLLACLLALPAFAQGIKLGGGGGAAAKIRKWVRASASLDFPSIAIGQCSSLTATVTGASVGDSVQVSANGSLGARVSLSEWYVSAANTVTVKACNNDTAAAQDPPARTFAITVFS